MLNSLFSWLTRPTRFIALGDTLCQWHVSQSVGFEGTLSDDTKTEKNLLGASNTISKNHQSLSKNQKQVFEI